MGVMYVCIYACNVCMLYMYVYIYKCMCVMYVCIYMCHVCYVNGDWHAAEPAQLHGML
jgi:hypothetical protein